MSGLFPGGPLRGLHRLVLNGCLLVGFLLATQALVPDLLADNQILQSVVRISAVSYSRQQTARGTGIAVEGGVVTAAHVVQNSDSISVFTGDGDDGLAYDGEVVYSDSIVDLAFIRVLDPNKNTLTLPPAKLNADFPIQAGTEVFAIGNSLGFTRTVSKGIVSASGFHKGERYLLTDALTRKGNSGGPLINHKGEVVAIVLGSLDTAPSGQLPMKDTSPEFTYTIPVADIKGFIESRGIAKKGYLGVAGKTVKIPSPTELTDEALEITKVATSCGLQTGDILVTLEDTPISTQRQLIQAVRRLSPGTTANAYIIRNGIFKIQPVSITSAN
jgi:serine protease Do